MGAKVVFIEQSSNSSAWEAPPAADTLVFELDEVVVTAFNRSQRLIDVPASITYLGNVLLEREEPTFNLIPVFDFVPGIFAHQGATNTSRISIRGIGARVPYATGKIRAYFNNIPLTNTSGITFIEDIDPAVIESMDVIKGPATSVYGAGLGGTIAITARRPQLRQTGFQNRFQAGSWGMFRNSAMAQLVGDRAASSLVYSRTTSEGYRENNQFRRDAVTSVSQFTAAQRYDITTLVAFTDLKSHIPSSIDTLMYATQPRSAAANWKKTRGYEDSRRLMAGANAETHLLENVKADLSLFTIWHDEKEMRPFDVFYEERLSVGARLKATHVRDITEHGLLELTAGTEWMFETYDFSNYENIDGEGVQGARFSDNNEKVTVMNAFVQSDATVDRWNFSAGVNVNFSRRNYTDRFRTNENDLSGNYDYGWIVSPRVSAGYRYLRRNAVFLTLSHGFSPPSLAETLTSEGQINPEIQPERSWNLEMGFRGSLNNNRFFYDLNVYSMQVRDLLVAERVGEDAWVGRNAGESLHRGVEVEIHWVAMQNFSAGFFQWKELSLRTNFTWNHFYFKDFVDLEDDFSGNKIPGVPDRVFFTQLYNELGGGLYFTAGYRWVGDMAMNDANTRHTEPYHLTDVSLGYKNDSFNRWNMDVFFRVNNLFNEKYASMILVNAPSFGSTPPRYYYPGLPVNYTLGVRMGIR